MTSSGRADETSGTLMACVSNFWWRLLVVNHSLAAHQRPGSYCPEIRTVRTCSLSRSRACGVSRSQRRMHIPSVPR